MEAYSKKMADLEANMREENKKNLEHRNA